MAGNKFSNVPLPPDCTPVYCSKCRRFLGYEAIRKGYALLMCPKCKAYNILVGKLTNVDRIMNEVRPMIEEIHKIKMQEKQQG